MKLLTSKALPYILRALSHEAVDVRVSCVSRAWMRCESVTHSLIYRPKYLNIYEIHCIFYHSGGSWFRPQWLRLPTSDPDAAGLSQLFGSSSSGGGGSGGPAVSASAAVLSSGSGNTASSGNFKGRSQTLGMHHPDLITSHWSTSTLFK